ncbi:MAG: aryl-sulfate sulfotransferase [Flavobacterium sp.]
MKNLLQLLKISPVLLVLLLLDSCYYNDEYQTPDNKLGSIAVSTGTLYPAFDPEVKDYYITSLNTLKQLQVTLNDYNATSTIYINNQKVQDKVTSLKLNPGQDIVIKSGKIQSEVQTYMIHYLPADMPKINLNAKNNPADGYIFVSLFEMMSVGSSEYSYLAILNNDGFPVFYKKIPQTAVFNFKSYDTPGGRRYSYNAVNTVGKVIVMDGNFDEIKQLELLPNNGHGSYPAENHDFLYFDDNHYVIPAYVGRSGVDLTAFGGGNSVTLTEVVLQEIQDNQVIFEWNSGNYPEFIAASDPIYQAQFSNPRVDYFHFNSIAVDPADNNFIISARHTNQIYKINRTTGAIMWRFGGNNDDFNLTGNQIISHPHHATMLPNGHLLLFDNGVTKNPPQSRIAEFALNQNTMTANLVFEYKETGRYFDIMGSAQKLANGNYLIGWGGNTTSQANANKSDITEVDANGNIQLDISFENKTNAFTYSYRALKYNITF